MKKAIIIIFSILFVVFFFIVGMFFWPLMAYITGWYVYIPPLVLAVVSFIAFVISCFRKSKVGIMILVPLTICNLLEFYFCGYRYRDGVFHGKAIIVRNLRNHLHDGLANPLGINILTPDYSFVHFCSFNDDLVEISKFDEGLALFSIEKKGIVLPFGQSLLTYAEVFEDYGLYGIMTKRGDIIIEPKYEMIEQLPGCFFVKYNNKYGTLTDFGNIKERPKYDSFIIEGPFIIVEKNGKWGILDNEGEERVKPKYESYEGTKEDRDGKKYFIFSSTGKYSKEKQYSIYKENSYDCYMSTHDVIKEIVRDDRFIIQHKDKYGVIDEKGHTIIKTIYDAINYETTTDEFWCCRNNDYIAYPYDINGNHL